MLSVLLPVYNASLYLEHALESLRVQSFERFEVIAINDGSTDDSEAILRKYAASDHRIRLISRPNTGIVGALNDGLALCTGEFVARMDADDVCFCERFAQQLEYLHRHTDCIALGSDVLYTDPEGSPLTRHRPVLDHDSIVNQLLEGNGGAMIHPSVIFRRAALERVGGYRQCCQWIEDLDLYIRLSEFGELANLPDVQLQYRQHLQSVNRRCGDREQLRREIVNPFRATRGLAPLPHSEPSVDEPRLPADWRRSWAYDAARGGYWDSARKNSLRALRMSPFDRRNWRCWRYICYAASPLQTRAPHFP